MKKKSGEVKDRHHESHNMDKFLGDKFETIGAPEKWYGQDIEVHSDPLVDSGKGKPIIMRFFEFKANPVTFKRDNPTNQQLFDAHANEIRLFLWRDGLKAFEGLEPRIIRSKKKDGYRIMVACEPRLGITLAEPTQTLQQIVNPT
jgi:hypothetical protein